MNNLNGNQLSDRKQNWISIGFDGWTYEAEILGKIENLGKSILGWKILVNFMFYNYELLIWYCIL